MLELIVAVGFMSAAGLVMLGVWRLFGHLLEPLLDYVYGH